MKEGGELVEAVQQVSESNPNSRRLRALANECQQSVTSIQAKLNFSLSNPDTQENAKLKTKTKLLENYVKLCYQDIHKYVKSVFEEQCKD